MPWSEWLREVKGDNYDKRLTALERRIGDLVSTGSKSRSDRREKPMSKGRTQVEGKNCPSDLRSEAAEWNPPADFRKSRAYVAPRFATHERARKERHGHSAGGGYYGRNPRYHGPRRSDQARVEQAQERGQNSRPPRQNWGPPNQNQLFRTVIEDMPKVKLVAFVAFCQSRKRCPDWHTWKKFESRWLKHSAWDRRQPRYGWRNVNMINRATSPAPSMTAPKLLSETAVEVDAGLIVAADGSQMEDIEVLYSQPQPVPVSAPVSVSLKDESEEANEEKGEVRDHKNGTDALTGAGCATDTLSTTRGQGGKKDHLAPRSLQRVHFRDQQAMTTGDQKMNDRHVSFVGQLPSNASPKELIRKLTAIEPTESEHHQNAPTLGEMVAMDRDQVKERQLETPATKKARTEPSIEIYLSGEKGLTTEAPSDDEELHPTLRDPLLQLTVLTSTGLNVAPTSEVWSEDQPKPTEDNLLLSQDPEANDWLRNCVVDMLRERQMNTDSLKFGLVDDWPPV